MTDQKVLHLSRRCNTFWLANIPQYHIFSLAPLFFFSLAPLLALFGLVFILLNRPCDVLNVDCGSGIRKNGFVKCECDCPDGTYLADRNQTESAVLPCLTDYCFDVTCINGKCQNSVEKYECLCNEGYQAHETIERYCIDIDECSIQNCGDYGVCRNTIGSFECDCDDGYTELDVKCVDHCYPEGKCGLGTCQNPGVDFECECSPGTGHDKKQDKCVDIDECEVVDCGNGKCENTIGDFSCSCEEGFFNKWDESSFACGKI